MKIHNFDISFENRAMLLLNLPEEAASGPLLAGRDRVAKIKKPPEGKKMFEIPPGTTIRIRLIGDRADITFTIDMISQIVPLDIDDEILHLASSALKDMNLQN